MPARAEAEDEPGGGIRPEPRAGYQLARVGGLRAFQVRTGARDMFGSLCVGAALPRWTRGRAARLSGCA